MKIGVFQSSLAGLHIDCISVPASKLAGYFHSVSPRPVSRSCQLQGERRKSHSLSEESEEKSLSDRKSAKSFDSGGRLASESSAVTQDDRG